MFSSQFVLAVSLLVASGSVAAAKENSPIKVLIVDGFSNHDWAHTTALIRGILEPTKRFRVDVATCPAKVTTHHMVRGPTGWYIASGTIRSTSGCRGPGWPR